MVVTQKWNFKHETMIKATSWSTNDDITDAHISATTQQILTKFSAVVTYVKQRQSGKFQFICTWVTMITKYIILKYGGKSRSKNKNYFCLIYLKLYMLVTCYFVSWIYLLPDNHPFIATRQRWSWIYLFFSTKKILFYVCHCRSDINVWLSGSKYIHDTK